MDNQPTPEEQPIPTESAAKSASRPEPLPGNPLARDPINPKGLIVGAVILVGVVLAAVGVIGLFSQPPAPKGIEPVGQIAQIETPSSEALTLANRVADEPAENDEETTTETPPSVSEASPQPQEEVPEPIAETAEPEPKPIEKAAPILAEAPEKRERPTRKTDRKIATTSPGSKRKPDAKSKQERSDRRATDSAETTPTRRESEPALSAYEQLLISRRSQAAKDSPKETPLALPPLSPTERQAFEKALSNVNHEFVRTLVEDGVNVAAIVGNGKWERVRKSPQYETTVNRIYDRVLSTDDKARLYAAMEARGSAPVSAPPSLKELPRPKVTLTEAQKAVRQQHAERIEKVVEGSQ